MRSIVEKTKKHFVLVSVQGDYLNNFIFKLSKMNIGIKKINYLNNNKIEILIKKDRYKELKKRFPGYKFKIKKDIGFYKIKPFIRKHRYFLISVLIGLITLYCLSRVILKVDVIHSNKNIRTLVRDELSDAGIRKYSLKKSYKKINEIKDNILDKYPDKIEWLEIENIGMTYVVYIEERIIKEKEEEYDGYCHVVADKSAIITKIISSKGEKVKVVDNNVVKTTPNRETLYNAQTPQAFRTNLIIKAYQNVIKNQLTITDDAQAYALAFKDDIYVVKGDYNNIKITNKKDLS